MASIRLELHVPAFNAYRNDPSVVEAMQEIADGIRSRAAQEVVAREDDTREPFRVTVQYNASRAVVFVSTDSIDGERAEAVNRAFSRAIP